MKRYYEAGCVAEIVSIRRQDLGMTQAELAKRLELDSANFISILEAGRSKVPIERVVDFAEALKMPPNWFLMRALRERYPQVAAFLAGDFPDNKKF